MLGKSDEWHGPIGFNLNTVQIDWLEVSSGRSLEETPWSDAFLEWVGLAVAYKRNFPCTAHFAFPCEGTRSPRTDTDAPVRTTLSSSYLGVFRHDNLNIL